MAATMAEVVTTKHLLTGKSNAGDTVTVQLSLIHI